MLFLSHFHFKAYFFLHKIYIFHFWRSLSFFSWLFLANFAEFFENFGFFIIFLLSTRKNKGQRPPNMQILEPPKKDNRPKLGLKIENFQMKKGVTEHHLARKKGNNLIHQKFPINRKIFNYCAKFRHFWSWAPTFFWKIRKIGKSPNLTLENSRFAKKWKKALKP